MNIYDYALMNNLLIRSAIKYGEFRNFFKNIEIDTVVEIGTFEGISATYMAQFVKRVFTFDVTDWSRKYQVWKDCGVENKIFYYTIKDREDIKKVIDKITFDFAFIDGAHTYEDVKADFELVKHCGKVLFHDVHNEQGVRMFVDELGIKCNRTVAYWTKEIKEQV